MAELRSIMDEVKSEFKDLSKEMVSTANEVRWLNQQAHTADFGMRALNFDLSSMKNHTDKLDRHMSVIEQKSKLIEVPLPFFFELHQEQKKVVRGLEVKVEEVDRIAKGLLEVTQKD